MKKLLFFVAMFCSIAFTAKAESTINCNCGDEVIIQATPRVEGGYHFARWSDGNTDNPRHVVVKDGVATNYTAIFEANVHSVTFKDWNGATLDFQEKVAYGSTITYSAAQPKRDPDAQYKYTFSGWSPEFVSGMTLMPDNDVVFVAQYDKEVQKYRVVYNNWDGSYFDEEWVAYGDKPKGPDANPTKLSDHYTHEFIGWDKEFSIIKGDPTTDIYVYTAQFKDTPKNYEVKIVVNGASTGDGELIGAGTYAYGSTVNLQAIPNECSNVKWDDNNSTATDRTINVEGNTTITVTFTLKTYTITVSVDGESVGRGTVSIEKKAQP
jgi:hypothetical protein